MANDKLITITQLKSKLKNYTNEQLTSLLVELAKECPQAKEFLTAKYSTAENIQGLLEKYKQKVQHEFYPKRGFGRLNLREAKKAISDFKKICKDKAMVIDIMLYYVENCVEFTADYGDINEAFYISAESIYGDVIKAVNDSGENTYNKFASRLKTVAFGACEGWGFQDAMLDMYYQLDWVHDEN